VSRCSSRRRSDLGRGITTVAKARRVRFGLGEAISVRDLSPAGRPGARRRHRHCSWCRGRIRPADARPGRSCTASWRRCWHPALPVAPPRPDRARPGRRREPVEPARGFPRVAGFCADRVPAGRPDRSERDIVDRTQAEVAIGSVVARSADSDQRSSIGRRTRSSALGLLLRLLAGALLEVAGEGTDHALLAQTDDGGVRAPRACSPEVGSGAAHPTESIGGSVDRSSRRTRRGRRRVPDR
jgi:hypothetical protein